MNIWIINHYALTPEMAGGTRHYDMAKALVGRGHSVTIFASSFHYASLEEKKTYLKGSYLPERVDGIDFVWIKTRPYRGNTLSRIINMLDFTRKVMRAPKLGLKRPDVIVGSSVHLFAVYAAYRLAQRYAVPFVMEVRDIWPQTLIDMGVSRYHPFVLLLGTMEKFLYKKAAKIITLLPRADLHIKKFGVEAKDIVWISNGVDLQRFAAPRPVELLDSKKFNVLYTGTFGTANNLDILIEVARRLETFKKIRFTLVGSGPEEEKLKAASQALENLDVLAPVAKTEVPGLLRSADLLYVGLKDLPLYRFGMSMNKLFDYMAAKRPVVFAADVAENPVVKAGSGLVVPPDDIEKIANAVITLYNATPQTREAMGNRGFRYVSEHFSMEAIADTFEDLMQKVIHEKRR